MMPFHVLAIWLRGLLALAILAGGIGLLREWYVHRRVVFDEPVAVRSEEAGREELRLPPPRGTGTVRRVVEWRFGLNRETAYLLGGLALITTALGGGRLMYSLRRRKGADDPRAEEVADSSHGGKVQRIRRPDGSELHVLCIGPKDGPPIVLTHGWGVTSAEWHYAKDHLARHHRLILWDLPGLGRSTRPADKDWSVLALAGDRPAVLLGHSIGGMIILTFCRLFPEALGRRVAGLILVHTTPTNPVKTAGMSGLYTALQKPVLEPLCYLMIGLAPLVWLMNAMSYWNGSLHHSTERDSFSGGETRQQLDFAARFVPKGWPAVVARGMLAMFRYDASGALARIDVPTLVVAGDRDRTTKPEASDWIAGAIPGATLLTLQPAKHMGHFEHHAAFAHSVADFVKSCGARKVSTESPGAA